MNAIKSEIMMTPEFRASYMSVFQPRENKLKTGKDGKPVSEYSVQMIFDAKAQKSAEFQKLLAVVRDMKAKLNADGSKDEANWMSPFKTKNPKKRPELEGGCVYCNAGAKAAYPPGVGSPNAGPDGKVMVLTDPAAFTSGDYAMAKLNVYAWDHPAAKWGVSFGLLSIQKRRDGEPLGMMHNVEDDFAPVAEAPVAGASNAAVDAALQATGLV